jgi:hypothetical protein
MGRGGKAEVETKDAAQYGGEKCTSRSRSLSPAVSPQTPYPPNPVSRSVARSHKHAHPHSQVDVILVSPLTRTMQTATDMFPEAAAAIAAAAASSGGSPAKGALSMVPPIVSGQPSFVAIEMCREAHGGHPCDQRRSISILRREFPHVDFSLVDTDEDTWHDPGRR